jgi:hypothetical protein
MLAAIIAESAAAVPDKNAVAVPGIPAKGATSFISREPCEVTLWRVQGPTNITVIYHNAVKLRRLVRRCVFRAGRGGG